MVSESLQELQRLSLCTVGRAVVAAVFLSLSLSVGTAGRVLVVAISLCSTVGRVVVGAVFSFSLLLWNSRPEISKAKKDTSTQQNRFPGRVL